MEYIFQQMKFKIQHPSNILKVLDVMLLLLAILNNIKEILHLN